jgi:nucleotide-binding universal stress UspA family protein
LKAESAPKQKSSTWDRQRRLQNGIISWQDPFQGHHYGEISNKRATERNPIMKPLQKILVPIDFSEATSKLVQTAIAFAEKFEARLLLVYVVEDLSSRYRISIPHISFDTLEKEMFLGAEAKMAKLLDKDPLDQAVCEGRVLQGHAAKQIIGLARTEDIDLIVMGTHGFTSLEKMILGSVTEEVIRSSPCPVLTVRP